MPAVGWAAAGVAVSGAAFWAGAVVARPAAPAPAPATEVAYTVLEGTVGHSLHFTASAAWPTVGLAASPVGGIVTSVDLVAGGEISSGQVLFTVDLQPVVAAVGEVPAFRDMVPGDRGPDIRQLQEFLVVTRGAELRPDGIFGPTTTQAVKEWERSTAGAPHPDGYVRLGEVIFVPQLPVRAVAAEDLRVGGRIEAGATAVEVLAPAPDVAITVTGAQLTTIPLDAPVTVTLAGEVLGGAIARTAENADGTVALVLEGTGGGPICADRCGELLPAPGPANVSVDIVVVPSTTGPAVPVAAVKTDPGGDPYVTTEDGRDVPVEVRASHGGLAVVQGIEPGSTILLPVVAR